MPDLLKKKAIAIKIMPQSNKILKIGLCKIQFLIFVVNYDMDMFLTGLWVSLKHQQNTVPTHCRLLPGTINLNPLFDWQLSSSSDRIGEV